MALELQIGLYDADRHACRLPWPRDPEMPEGHACECGQRWVYQPARWEALYTVEELRRQQEAGEFLRGIIKPFRQVTQTPDGDPAVLPDGPRDPGADYGAAVIVPIPSPKVDPPRDIHA